MPTHRAATPSRSAGRFSRGGASGGAAPRRVPGRPLQRRTPPKSAPKRALDGVTSVLPDFAKGRASGAGAKSSKGRRGGKAGGIALATAAAGVAFKNRDRLMGMLNRKGDEQNAKSETSPVEAGTRPTTGAADPARAGNIAPTDPGNRPDIPPPSAP